VILRDQYISPFGHIRIGRLLEDLDALAGITTFSHTDDADHRTRALSIVTASVDRIQFKRTLSPNHNLRLIGTPTWVGRSSMEVRIDVEEENIPNQFERIAVAYFTMAARDPAANKATQSRYPSRFLLEGKTILSSSSFIALRVLSINPFLHLMAFVLYCLWTFSFLLLSPSLAVNKLQPETEEEKRRFKQGELNKQRRLAAAEISLQKQPPSAEERFIIHDLFMRSSKAKDSQTKNFVKMISTTLQSVTFCQSQERNLANKIFGGYLMRKGFEVAFTTARLYSRTDVPPLCTAMEEVTFHRPVDIGDILSLKVGLVLASPSPPFVISITLRHLFQLSQVHCCLH
jgi:acyl-coenzyme A thioesterase 9